MKQGEEFGKDAIMLKVMEWKNRRRKTKLERITKETDGVVMSTEKKKKDMKKGVNEHKMKDVTLLYSTHSLEQRLYGVTQHRRVRCGVLGSEEHSPSFNNRLCCHLTDLVAHGSPLQQQSEAVGCLLVVLQALTQPTIIILHQPPVHNHFKLA